MPRSIRHRWNGSLRATDAARREPGVWKRPARARAPTPIACWRARALATALGVLVALPLAAPGAPPSKRPSLPGINGSDDRTLVRTSEHPWSAIGRVNNTLGPFCTGTLIGPRRVLTAAHCLWNTRTGRWLPPCALHFLAGYQRGRYLAHAHVVGYELAGGGAARPARPQANPAEDWAVLTLGEDLGSHTRALPTAPLDAKRLDVYRAEHGVFIQAGYSRDRPHILTKDETCGLGEFSHGGRIVTHTCDATFGDSGSPLLLKRGDRYEIVAVLVGIDRARGTGIALGGAAFHEALQRMAPAATLEETAKAC